MFFNATPADLNMLNRILTEWTIRVGRLCELCLLPSDAQKLWVVRRDRCWLVYIRNLRSFGGITLPSHGAVLSELRRHYLVNPTSIVLSVAVFLEGLDAKTNFEVR